jgi:dTDP-glucose 4,6-dehydratase
MLVSENVSNALLAEDQRYILSRIASLLPELKNAKILLTGGTGFFGKSLLLALQGIEGINVTVLSRDPDLFIKEFPYLQFPGLKYIKGDTRNFEVNEAFTHVIHAATAASAVLNESNPLAMLSTILEGTQHVLDLCVAQAEKPQVLFVSSGAVYGRQPADIAHISEAYQCAPDIYNTHNAYGIGKYTAEHLCCQYHHLYHLSIKMARCFAFVGPYLPLDAHFAVGNFIRDGLNGGPIKVNSDGSAFRSYQYAADLVVWLLHILVRGQSCYPYNVGSDEDYDIEQIAHKVASFFNTSVEIAKKRDVDVLPARYVPSVQRAMDELNLPANLVLEVALAKTISSFF